MIITNRPKAFVLKRAEKFETPSYILEKGWQENLSELFSVLQRHKIDLIVLAGFMQLIPSELVKQFKGQIINIHPALLPNYGGKGMYGMNVHKAVKMASEKETGITIHQVNEQYDKGKIIFQAKTTLNPSDTEEDIQKKVQKLEHLYFSKVIEKYIFWLNQKHQQKLPFAIEELPA